MSDIRDYLSKQNFSAEESKGLNLIIEEEDSEDIRFEDKGIQADIEIPKEEKKKKRRSEESSSDSSLDSMSSNSVITPVTGKPKPPPRKKSRPRLKKRSELSNLEITALRRKSHIIPGNDNILTPLGSQKSHKPFHNSSRKKAITPVNKKSSKYNSESEDGKSSNQYLQDLPVISVKTSKILEVEELLSPDPVQSKFSLTL